MNIEQFSECCLAKLCRDENGKLDLVVCCVLRGPDGKKIVKKKQIDLRPVVQFVHNAIASYHKQLHQPEVSGWDQTVDSAVDTARRMGEARMVKALFHEVSPMLANMEAHDNTESEMHQKAHEVLVKAREGDRTSLDIMSALMNAAYRGNARALEIMTLMRDMNLALDGKEAAEISGIGCAGMTTPQLIEIGSWWSKFKKVAKVVTAPVWAPTYLATKAISKVPGLRLLNKVNPAAWVINRFEGGRRPSQPQLPPAAPPMDELPPPAAPPSDQSQGYAPDPGYAGDQGGGYDEGYDEPEFAGPQEEVSGWAYNKGYRTVAETVTSKFPGLGISMREMYHRGLDSSMALAIAPTSNTPAPDVLDQTAQQAPTAVSGTYVVGLSWGSLMKKAKGLVKAVKDTGIIQKIAPIVASAIPGGGMALEAAKHAAEIVALAKEGKHEAVKMVAAVRAMATDGNQQALETAKVMMNMSNKLDDKAAAAPPVPAPVIPVPVPMPAPVVAPVPVASPAMVVYRAAPTYRAPVYYASSPAPTRGGFYHRGLGHRWINKHLRHMGQPTIAGWLYNKPYRGVLEAPGAGVAMREMYNRGEGRQPTELLDVLRQVFPTKA